MLRRLGGCVVALALLLPAQALTAQAAPSADQRAAATKTRMVKLGHKPVRATTAHKVRLTFEGRKGQLVNLARVDAAEQCGGRILRRGGKTVKPWAQGYWRLPRTASYTAINKPCRNQEKARVRLQVRKVVRQDRLTTDDPVTSGRSARVTHLIPFRVLADERAHLGGGGRLALIRPDRSTTRDVAPGHLGFAVPGASGASGVDVASLIGRWFVEVEPRTEVSLSTSTVRTVAVDGSPTIVPAGRYARLSFTGTAGQWVYAEITSATTGQAAYQHRMYNVGPAEQSSPVEYFLPAVQVECPGSTPGSCMVTQLPAAGTYVVSLPISPGDDTDVSVRVRSAARALPATVDGPAVSYAVTTPGRWVVGDLPEVPKDAAGGSGATITLANVSMLVDWRVRAVSGYGPCNPGLFDDCFAIDATPNAFTLSPARPTSPLPFDAFANPAVAVLAVPPGATGSLDLTVTKDAPQP